VFEVMERSRAKAKQISAITVVKFARPHLG
jgi:hypothetical protein